MLVCISTGNQDIIKVCVTAGKTIQDLVNKPLKGLSCIDQAKGHAHELK